MPLSRRRFMRETALAAGGLALAGTARAEKDIPMNTARPLFISTWAFGKVANEQSLRIAEQGGSVLDAVERGIHVAEADAANASVGLGGIPNAQGVVQLDACIMDGEGQRAGSVAAIEGISASDLGGASGDGRDQACHARWRRGAAVCAGAGFCQR